MMVLQQFYEVVNFDFEHNTISRFKIKLNANHEIYGGHFPGNPVVPGVCLIQILKELVGQITSSNVRLIQSQNIKFLKVVNPNINPLIDWEIETIKIENSELKVKSSAYCNDQICFKFSGIFSASVA